MTASGGRMEWNSGGNAAAPSHPPYPPYPLYDSYRYPHDQRIPPTPVSGPPPPPYQGYPPHGPSPSQTRSHHDYWYEQHQRRPVGYGPPPMHEGGSPSYYHGEGRQGPPRGYPDGRMPPHPPFGGPAPPDAGFYRGDRPDVMYPPSHGMVQQQPYHTPTATRRDAAVVQTSSFSSKEDTPQEEGESSNWEPSGPQDEGNKKRGDPLSLLAKVSSDMAPPRSRKEGQASEREESEESKNEDQSGSSVTSPKKAGMASPLQRRLRSSPIITPNSAAPPPPQHRHVPPHMREAHRGGGNAVTPKPITPTGTNYYGPPPPPPHHHHGYEDPRGGPPSYPPYGAPPRGSYAPPPPGSYPSGYDSRAGSWEQPPGAPPVVVEERSSFDSLESSYGPPRQYYPDYSRNAGGSRYPPYAPPPPTEGWYPDQHRSGGSYPAHRWDYEQGPPRYPPPPQYHQQQPRGPPYPPPPQHYYDDRGISPYHQPSPPPAGSAPYSHVQQPSEDDKTVLHKKFSWKHFPELERFLIENRDDYLKHSSRNYTVEQKQFNNDLTERLIELAEKQSYVFDPEEFNFVAIRDRIRCYYKSYVQTARKRGLLLPTDTKTTTAFNKTETKDNDESMRSEDAEETEDHAAESHSQDKEERE